jgi:3-deoxy-manno-octulosonate cytidylyltransferase (CMP-KDO synthetase)
MTTVAVIPARMGSSRYPGKPLAKLLGMTMIEHVYRRTAMCRSISNVYVATCDAEIRDAVEAFGGNAIMTSDRHERASERVAEAIQKIDAQIVVMVQGDEPMVYPEMLDEAVAPMLHDDGIVCTNLLKQIDDKDEFLSRNTIKVVVDRAGRALYMSRQPIPDCPAGDFSRIKAYKQVCIMPFRRSALEQFVALAPTTLEIAESIDMLRFLENGVPVHMVPTNYQTYAVDTPDDLARVAVIMQKDPLVAKYISGRKA